MTSNPDYPRACHSTLNTNDTRETHYCYRPLTASDLWHTELCHCQWLWSTFGVI